MQFRLSTLLIFTTLIAALAVTARGWYLRELLNLSYIFSLLTVYILGSFLGIILLAPKKEAKKKEKRV